MWFGSPESAVWVERVEVRERVHERNGKNMCWGQTRLWTPPKLHSKTNQKQFRALFFFFLLLLFSAAIRASRWARSASTRILALRSSSTACSECRARLRSFLMTVSSSSRPVHFFFQASISDLTFVLDDSRSVKASSRVAVSCFSAKRCFSMVRMRASWSSTNCACAISLLWWRDVGGDGAVVAFVGGGLPGRGGRGIAGGGDGKEVWDALFRRFEFAELERWSVASLGSRDSRCEFRFVSPSWD